MVSNEQRQRQRDWLTQAELFDRASSVVFDAVGIGAGLRCLDIGCGPGSTMRLLGSRVGAGGSVTGLDFDAGVGEAAVEWLRGLDQRCTYDFIEANVDDAELGEQYDIVFGRAILIHAADPAQALARMWRFTKPGGCLVAQEYDFGTVCVHPDQAWMAQWRRVLFGTLEAAGRDPRIGRSLPLLFERAGIGWPEQTAVGGALRPLGEVASALEGMYTRLLQIPLPRPLATPEQAAELVRQLANPPTPEPYVLMQAAIGAWRRKPA